MVKIISHIRAFILEIKSRISIIPKHKLVQIPYYSQWEDKSLVKNIILKKITAKKDKLWKNSGAKSIEEYEFWSWHVCGMACLKMILDHKYKKKYPIIKLAKESENFGVYIPQKDDIKGMFYQPFCNYVKEKFNLDCDYSSFLSIRRIIYEISQNNYVIASVNPAIRAAHKNKVGNGKKGGHLVLITGYDLEKRQITFHNPSGFNKESQENYSLSFETFQKYFANRGLVIE